MTTKSPKQKKTAPTKAIDQEKPKPAVRKKRTVKGASAKVGLTLSVDPKPSPRKPVIKHEDIALRAYFIAERRHKMGWPGNSATDWADAEKQLRAEFLENTPKKR